MTDAIPKDVWAAAREAYHRHIDAFDAEDADGIRGVAYIIMAERERTRAMLLDPIAVHANMLRGTIAKPSVPNILHLYRGDIVPVTPPGYSKVSEYGGAAGRPHQDDHDRR